MTARSTDRRPRDKRSRLHQVSFTLPYYRLPDLDNENHYLKVRKSGELRKTVCGEDASGRQRRPKANPACENCVAEVLRLVRRIVGGGNDYGVEFDEITEMPDE